MNSPLGSWNVAPNGSDQFVRDGWDIKVICSVLFIKLELTTKQMIPTILLTISFNTFKYDSISLLLCNGFFFPRKRQQSSDGFHADIEVVVNELERNVVNRFRELNVCEEEYVLLKLVFLFSHSESIAKLAIL
ncbi:hypothetical protein COOONC_23904 [Cooperia oncophora]